MSDLSTYDVKLALWWPLKVKFRPQFYKFDQIYIIQLHLYTCYLSTDKEWLTASHTHHPSFPSTWFQIWLLATMSYEMYCFVFLINLSPRVCQIPKVCQIWYQLTLHEWGNISVGLHCNWTPCMLHSYCRHWRNSLCCQHQQRTLWSSPACARI